VVPQQRIIPLRFQLGVTSEIGSGAVPAPAWSFSGAFAIQRGGWSLGLEPRVMLPSRSTPQRDTSAQAKLSMLSASLVPCYGNDGWRACLLTEIGRLRSRGEVVAPKRDDSLWTAGGLRLAYRVGHERGWSGTAALDGLYAFSRLSVLLNGQSVYHTPPFQLRLGIGVIYGF
jgi:hypothetical protein